MKKLTLVSFKCRYKKVSAFVMAEIVDGKAVVPESLIDKLFWDLWGFMPQRGETISIG